MLKIGYNYDGEEINEDLEEVIDAELTEAGFNQCGQDQDLLDTENIRWLEYEGEGSAAEMNAQEQAFIGSEAATTLEEIVGTSTVLKFEFEPWDLDDEEDAAPTPPPSDKKLMFFGWCHGTDNAGKKHDKIWGVVSTQGEWVTFWGGRTKKLSFKKSDEYASGDSLDTMIRGKRRKDYNDTTMAEMNALDPTFEQRFEEELILCLMANNFHQAPVFA